MEILNIGAKPPGGVQATLRVVGRWIPSIAEPHGSLQRDSTFPSDPDGRPRSLQRLGLESDPAEVSEFPAHGWFFGCPKFAERRQKLVRRRAPVLERRR